MKTRDGKFKLQDIEKLAQQVEGVTIEHGTRHSRLLKYHYAQVGICALDKSTDIERHIIPWLKKVTGYTKQEIYTALREGQWN